MTNTTDLPYKNPNLPAEERIADLLGRMTLEENVGQMMQLDARSGDLDDLIVNKHVGSILHTSPADLPRAVETVNTKTRLGIPLIIGDDCIHGYSFWPGSTIFPSQLGMATSFDPAKVPGERVIALAQKWRLPDGVPVRHPAFDVTPARLVTAIVTEAGVARAPYEASLAQLVRSGCAVPA